MAPYNQPILIFSEGISFCHIVRPLIIARWLKELTLPIVVACTKASSSLFAQEGYQTEYIETADPAAIYTRMRHGGFVYEKKDLLKYFVQDDALIKRLQPRLIVSDFRFTALQLAKKYSIPSVGITSASCHPNFLSDIGYTKSPDYFTKPRFLPLWVFDTLAPTAFSRLISRQILKYVSAPLREASLSYGLEVLPSFFDYASQGDICLLSDHPEVMPIQHLRPGDFFTGPLHWERPDPLPAALSQLDQHKKTVYITVGTQEALNINFLESYIKKLLRSGLQVILSRGKRSFDIATTHENLFVFDFVNEDKLLSQVSLFVYHGGAMSTYQGMLCAVPMIALPAQVDQHFHAEALVNHKVGVFFRPSRLKIEEFVSATLRLVKDKEIKAHALSLQKRLLAFNPRESIVSCIKTLC